LQYPTKNVTQNAEPDMKNYIPCLHLTAITTDSLNDVYIAFKNNKYKLLFQMSITNGEWCYNLKNAKKNYRLIEITDKMYGLCLNCAYVKTCYLNI